MSEGLPTIEELRPAPNPAEVFPRFAAQPHCLFLDSALAHREVGRYSFLVADPFEFHAGRADEVAWTARRARPPRGGKPVPAEPSHVFPRLEAAFNRWRTTSVPGLPPFQGGAAGLFAYDLNRAWEKIPAPRFDEFQTPALAVGFYDVVLAFDRQEDRAWIVSQGFPETEEEARRRRAAERIRQVKRWLEAPPPAFLPPVPAAPFEVMPLAPQFPVRDFPELTSNFSPEGYRQAIERTIEYIRAGDAFQVNLAQRLLFPAREHAVPLYLRLRSRNPAPFAAYFDLGEFQVVSASPERFVSVRSGAVEARPIKGTRRRAPHPVADLFTGDDLRESEKDRAENVMIVDLLRNDLSRVCAPETVRVTQLCGLELYRYVQHLVSVVRGELAPDRTPQDLIRAAFPGGSVTGAPKVRAMEIIAELEPTARGPYCGSIGYLGFDGTLDLNILIRSITAGRGWWQFPVGGGIVAQSDAAAEYEETWHKAAGLLKALR